MTDTTPRGPDGPGGPGAPGGGGAPLAMLLLDTQVAGALALTAPQQALWSALQAAEQAARTQRDAAHAALRELVASQFASGAPDLVAIEQAMGAEHQAMAATGSTLGSQAIALYAQLNTGQQAIVVSAAQARYQRASRR